MLNLNTLTFCSIHQHSKYGNSRRDNHIPLRLGTYRQIAHRLTFSHEHAIWPRVSGACPQQKLLLSVYLRKPGNRSSEFGGIAAGCMRACSPKLERGRIRVSVVHEPARRMVPLDSRLEPPRNRQETAKKPPRGSSLESSRLVDPCPSRLQSPRGSSQLVDPCSSRQELDAKRLEPARLVHNTNKGVCKIYPFYPRYHAKLIKGAWR